MLVGPTTRRRRLGADLRRLREARSLRLDEVAVHLGVAPSTLSRIETGKAPTRTSYLSLMLDLYGVTDPAQRRLLADLAREGQRKGWWADYEDLLPAGSGIYLGLEADARTLRAFGAYLVHDLLQTREYAAAVLAAGRPELSRSQLERLVDVRTRRQELLAGDDPVQLTLVLDESALLRSFGSQELMRGQLGHLAEAASRPAVTVRVLRLAAAGRPAPAGSFAIVGFGTSGDADVLCAEGLRGQLLLAERAADVDAMRLMFDALSAAALPPADSLSLIGELAAAP